MQQAISVRNLLGVQKVVNTFEVLDSRKSVWAGVIFVYCVRAEINAAVRPVVDQRRGPTEEMKYYR